METLKRHRFLYGLLQPAVALFAKWRFNFTYESLKDVDGPYLLLPNHNLELDPVIVVAASKKQMYFVASEHLSRKGWVTRLLVWAAGPIFHQKGRNGAHTVKAILRNLREGNNVCLFPEGNRSFNGLTCPISPATGKMAKRSGAKLVTYKFEGHYLTHPRWAKTIRRGKLVGKIVHVYTPEQLQAMTDQEVNDAIVLDLYEDAYATQAREMAPFRGKDLALGMETTVFACPRCGCIGHLGTDSDHLFCSCGFKARYDVYGYLTDGDGKRYTVTELDKNQKAVLSAAFAQAGEESLFSDSVLLQEIGDDHVLLSETPGTLTAYHDRLELCGTVLPAYDLLGVTIYSRNVLVIHTISDGKHYEIRGNDSFNALKYWYLYDLWKEK